MVSQAAAGRWKDGPKFWRVSNCLFSLESQSRSKGFQRGYLISRGLCAVQILKPLPVRKSNDRSLTEFTRTPFGQCLESEFRERANKTADNEDAMTKASRTNSLQTGNSHSVAHGNLEWDAVRQSYYYISGNRRVYQRETVSRADTAWIWDPYVQQQCKWWNGVYVDNAGRSV